ncbi:alanine:cation symporter family protein [Micrococcus endophyticus]|uniref:alanine:cation symporter family protein n=1 Tax=Micrococcus endophyticus TaxID=455343 RepID=UPI003817473A
MLAVQMGAARSLFSNESGMGTASIAASWAASAALRAPERSAPPSVPSRRASCRSARSMAPGCQRRGRRQSPGRPLHPARGTFAREIVATIPKFWDGSDDFPHESRVRVRGGGPERGWRAGHDDGAAPFA